jgi:hypothetical protein
MRRVLLAVVALLLVGQVGAQSLANDQQTSLPVPAMIELPAGVNLISAPVDAGSGLAIGAFQGIEPDWPLFFGWDGSSQQFTDPSVTNLTMGGGYWYYTPAPTTVFVSGQPYRAFKQLTFDVTPGWHLFGVPFVEGIEWHDLRLYASGNPVGIQTAKELGWIKTPVLSQWGSRWVEHVPGQPFEPGHAYWLKTNVPLSVRAERSTTPQASSAFVAGTQSAQEDPSACVVTGWIAETAEATKGMIESAAMIAEGHFVTGGLTAIGAAFGLAHYGMETTTEQLMEQLQEMDAKLDTLITDVTSIQGQLGVVLGELNGLDDYMKSEDLIITPMNNAKAWLDMYYINQKQPYSRNWARWVMAGCDPGTQATCTTLETQATYDAFQQHYVQHIGSTQNVTDDFFLYWAYAVIGDQENGVGPFIQGGDKANGHVTLLKQGLSDHMGTKDNGLMAYMNYVFSQSPCATDVANCDLYAEVYLPVEAVFQEAIGYQTQLVEAMMEAYSVLASVDQGAHGGDMRTYQANVNEILALETESFVEVAEQIALYRAADGRWDWSNFGTTDAAQLLARADWVAARVGGPVAATCDGCALPGNPPWPETGVVGHIIYASGESIPTVARQLCPASGACTTLPEVTSTPRSVDGVWPYLMWHKESDVAVGTPTTAWQVRRLVPQTLADGQYHVTSAVSKRGTSSLVVADYDKDYHNPPEDPTTAMSFGSFVGLEGNLGVWGLGDGRSQWSTSGAKDNSTHNFTVTIGSTSVVTNVDYLQITNDDNYFQGGDESVTTKLKIVDSVPSLLTAYPNTRIYWPMTVNVDAESYAKVNCYAATQDGYWNTLEHDAVLQDSGGHTVSGTTMEVQPCGTDHFDSCTFASSSRNSPPALISDNLILKYGSQYTLKGHFSDELHMIYKPNNTCWWMKLGYGSSKWERHFPTFYVKP